MRKVKIFMELSVKDLENSINEFAKDNYIVQIEEMTQGRNYFSCIVLYESQE